MQFNTFNTIEYDQYPTHPYLTKIYIQISLQYTPSRPLSGFRDNKIPQQRSVMRLWLRTVTDNIWYTILRSDFSEFVVHIYFHTSYNAGPITLQTTWDLPSWNCIYYVSNVIQYLQIASSDHRKCLQFFHYSGSRFSYIFLYLQPQIRVLSMKGGCP